MKIIGIACSPRPRGNSTILLEEALKGAREAGFETEIYRLAQMNFSMCIGCDKCSEDKKCVFEDDLTELFPKLEKADGIIISASVFGMGLNALGKSMVDRSQIYWARKYVFEDEPFPSRPGALIACAGTTFEGVFNCMVKPIKYFYKMLDVDYRHQLLHNPVDKPGEIKEKEEALAKAYQLGKNLL
ncbi:flavodoxin family protein [Fuchsiella alkaliacetigena]|uniref:flavodoxin family protein n=1 Tax=Fuchsiella alkaliacetigena TaxID=957042 RepID=UPI00200AA162|nr:flavodoxin family protein [Fuchsiella alkaliacetigena]MCK8825274.1 flavodoxin family protein [Fuchsiella alkaliacetigena]